MPTILTVLVIVAIGGIVYLTNWFGLATAPSGAPESKSGDIASLHVYAQTISEASPAQFATTGYAWDKAEPKKVQTLTLTASSYTSYSNAVRGHSYEATAFDSTHFCAHDDGVMQNEALDLVPQCKNVTVGAIQMSFYEKGTLETTNAISGLTAGLSKSYNKFLLEGNATRQAFPLKAICFTTNATAGASHIQSITVSGWDSDLTPSNAYSSCVSVKEPIVVNAGDVLEQLNPITFTADGTGITTDETVTVTLMDNCEYVASDGSVKTDYFKRDTIGKSDCGATNPTTSIALSD